MPFRGSYGTLMVSSALFLVVVLAMGYLISVIAKTQLVASHIALLTGFLPAFLLSGFIYPIDGMPAVLRVFTHIIPARYYVSILKGVFLKGSSISLLRGDLLSLVGFGIVVGTLATRALQKRLD